MNENNFEYRMTDNFTTSNNFDITLEFKVVMRNGELTVNDIEYQFEPDDPMYAFARQVARLRGLII